MYIKYRPTNFCDGWCIAELDGGILEKIFYETINRFKNKGIEHIIEIISEQEYIKIGNENHSSWVKSKNV